LFVEAALTPQYGLFRIACPFFRLDRWLKGVSASVADRLARRGVLSPEA
jgi:hypothetical protein